MDSIDLKNARTWQPVHNNGKTMPTTLDPHGGIGRNYGYLDGHAQWLQYGDWPGAGQSIVN
jgi:prepilin-type processing-associated H-X9-DG protein